MAMSSSTGRAKRVVIAMLAASGCSPAPGIGAVTVTSTGYARAGAAGFVDNLPLLIFHPKSLERNQIRMPHFFHHAQRCEFLHALLAGEIDDLQRHFGAARRMWPSTLRRNRRPPNDPSADSPAQAHRRSYIGETCATWIGL